MAQDYAYSRVRTEETADTGDLRASFKPNFPESYQPIDNEFIRPHLGPEGNGVPLTFQPYVYEPPPRTCRNCVEETFCDPESKFQSFIAAVILANAITIGCETDIPDLNWLWEKLEIGYLAVFSLDLYLQLFAFRCEYFTDDNWKSNWFDFSMVLSGYLDLGIGLFVNNKESKLSAIIRLMRLFRVLRLFRLLKMFKQLYMLVNGFRDSLASIFWISVLAALYLYMCAILLTRTLGRHNSFAAVSEETHEMLHEQYGTVAKSMFSLFQLMANPELDHLRLLMFNDVFSMVFFLFYTVCGSFAMLSILTGVISEGMIDKGNTHKEEMRFQEERKKKAFVEVLRKHFVISDVDGDGELSLDEFRKQIPWMVDLFKKEGLTYAPEDMEMVFNLVDFDNGGVLQLDEFLEGMTSFTANVSDLPMQLLRLRAEFLKYLKEVTGHVEERQMTALGNLEKRFDGKLQLVLDKLSSIESRLPTLR